MGCDWSMFQSLSTWVWFWMNQVLDGAECRRKVVSERKVAGNTRSLVNTRSLHFECARVFHEALLVPVLLYVSETMAWREKERSSIWVQEQNGNQKKEKRKKQGVATNPVTLDHLVTF